MVGGDRGYQGGLADLQDADPVAGRNSPHPVGLGGDLGHHIDDDLGGRRVRGIFKLHHLTSAVVVANRADEPHDGSRRLMAHQFLVFGQQDRLIGQRGTHHPGIAEPRRSMTNNYIDNFECFGSEGMAGLELVDD